MTRHAAPYLLAAPATLLLAGLLAGPLVLLARVSLYEPPRGRGFFTPGTWTADNFAAVTDPHGLRLVAFTLAFGAGVAALTLVLAYPLALAIRSLRPRVRTVALAAVLLPKVAGPLVVLFGLQQFLGAAGPVNRSLAGLGVVDGPVRLNRNLVGAVVGEVSLILPYAVLVLVVQMLRIDPALKDAARGLGASRWQTFRRVTGPLSRPGVVLAGQLALVWGLGAFLGPMFLGGPAEATLAVEAHRQAFEYGRWPRAAAVGMLLLAAVGVGTAGYAALTRSVGKCRK